MYHLGFFYLSFGLSYYVIFSYVKSTKQKKWKIEKEKKMKKSNKTR